MRQSDEELMRRCAQGDGGAFEEIAARYRPRLIAMARKWLPCSDLADEAAQDVLVAAYRARGRYQPLAPFASWLFTLAANHLRDLARRSRRMGARGVLGDAAVADPADAALDAAAFWEALGGLPPNQRASLLLHELYGLDHGEIAQLFGVAEGTARAWTTRARAEARRRLEASDIRHRRKQ